MLILSAKVNNPAAGGGPTRESIHAIEASLERPAKIIGQSLAEVKTIRKRRAGDLRGADINGFEMRGIVASAAEKRKLGREFRAKRVVKPRGFCFRSGIAQPIRLLP